MKQIVLFLFLSISWVTAQTKESFESFLVGYQKSFFGPNADEVADRWEGIKTWEGFDLVIGELLKNEGGHRRMLSFYILKRMQLPPDEMVDRLLVGAEAALQEPSKLPGHLTILDKFPQDDRIIVWLAGLLSDRRLVPDPKRVPGEDRSGGSTARVCDCASGTIARMLIERNQIPKQGLGVGDPSLDYNYPGRDRFNLALARKLNELGFTVKEPSQGDGQSPNSRPDKNDTNEQKEPNRQDSKNSVESGRAIGSTHEGRRWVLWIGFGIFSLALISFVVKRVSKS